LYGRKNNGVWLGADGATTVDPNADTGGVDVSARVTGSGGMYPCANIVSQTALITARFTDATFIHTKPTGANQWTAGGSSGTAPTLSGASGTPTGQTTANLNVTTNQGNGTLYWIVSTSATPPSAAQITAGQDSTGATAVAHGSQAVTASGVQSASASGLTASTAYYAYYMQTNASSLNSSIVSASFTTNSSALQWSTTDKSTSVTLSNSNLTASNTSGSYGGVRATNSKTSGKWYFEVHCDSLGGNFTWIGVANASANLSAQMGADTNSAGYNNTDPFYYGGSYQMNGTAFGAGDVIGVAFDATAQLVWISINNVWANSGNPGAGTRGVSVPGITTFYPAMICKNGAVTARFTAASQSYAAPTGFTSIG
jgi:hypothetical protein